MTSQNKVLSGKKIALLAANGFNEKTLTGLQRAVMKEGGVLRIVSPEAGLISGWNIDNWGHHYAIDKNLGEALGTDYDALIIPGGSRSIDKLNMTEHTKRFVNSFMSASKPIVAFDNALKLLLVTGNMAGRTVAGPADMQEEALRAGVIWSEDQVAADGNIITGACTDDEDREVFVSKTLKFLSPEESIEQAAA